MVTVRDLYLAAASRDRIGMSHWTAIMYRGHIEVYMYGVLNLVVAFRFVRWEF